MAEGLKLLTKDNEGEDIITFFENIVEGFALPMTLNFYYIASIKQKCLITIKKIPDPYRIGLDAQLIVCFNETYFDMLKDDKIKTILIEQEVDKIECDSNKGTIKIGKPSIATGVGIIKKYEYKEVERAIETEKALEKQLSAKGDGME